MDATRKCAGGQGLAVDVAILAVFLFATGGCGGRPADKQFQADALRVDGRYAQAIHFSALGVRVPLPRNAYVRVDAPLANTAEHGRLLLRELGVTATNIAYGDPAHWGETLHLNFRDGRECCFIWVIRDADARVTRMRLEHEKYHAVCRVAPEAIRSLSARISELGFRLNLSDHDEELAAILVQILSLHLEGIPLEDIQGSDLTQKAARILRESRVEPNRTKPSASSVDSQVSVQWPQGKDFIEIPLEFLDDIPVVRCQLNGKLAILYVDTACQPICLYADRLARFGINAGAQVDYPRYTALGHVERTSFTGGFLLTFKDGLGMEVSGVPCLPGGGRDPNHDVDGILGVKVMKVLNAVVDFRAGKLVLALKKDPKTEQRTGASRSGVETNR
ncbi:MAG: hypothetical protein ABSF95_17920 [Verrucomicrobiota bacterium]|jgi:hypothetical protein